MRRRKAFSGASILRPMARKPKQLNRLVTETCPQANPWIGDWLSVEMSRGLDLVVKHDNLVRIDATFSLLTLASRVISRFESEKKLRGAYDFDDLILKTHELLVHKATAQWVLFKLDRGIEHVLVDEAQDTSLAQWQILSALTEEFFSGTGSREVPDRTLFVVGDRKQSIFSFQGADPAAFEESREIFGRRSPMWGNPSDLLTSLFPTAPPRKC